MATYPFGDQKSATAGHVILANFLKTLEPLSSKIFVITGNVPEDRVCNKKIHLHNINKYDKKESLFLKFLKCILIHLKISIELIKISKNIDIIIFFLGGATLLFPLLSAKLLRKKIVVIVPGSLSKSAEMTYSGRLFGLGIVFIFRVLEHINLHLADQIAIESESAINFMGLNKYRKNISINGARYIDTDSFKIKKELKDRRNLIGYIGRLSVGKGVANFAKAIPLILKERDDLEFLIGGDGQLFEEIKKELKNNGSYDKVELTGWIPHDELPKYLNELKLIILPSYSEGLPGIIQEGMACGIVVLATRVGGIPDLIKDGKTGFILKDNSPECIARDVMSVLNYPDLGEIVKNARELVEKEYTYEATVERFGRMLEGLS